MSSPEEILRNCTPVNGVLARQSDSTHGCCLASKINIASRTSGHRRNESQVVAVWLANKLERRHLGLRTTLKTEFTILEEHQRDLTERHRQTKMLEVTRRWSICIYDHGTRANGA